MRSLTFRLACLLTPTLLTTALLAQSPMFRGNAAHTGVYAAPQKTPEGKIAWEFEALNWESYRVLEDMDGGSVQPTTPAVVGDRLYFSAGPFFFAVGSDGKQVYRKRLPGRSLASPAVSGDLAYVPTDTGTLLALELADGSVRWGSPIGAPTFTRQVDPWDAYQSSPVVAEGFVYVGSHDGRIYAFDAGSGKQRWHFQTKHVVRATPAVAQNRVFCGSFDGHVYALDATTGKLLWDVSTKTPDVPWNAVQGSCAVEGDIVYVGSRSTYLYALDAATGKVLWRHSHDGSWVPSSPAVRDGITFVGQSDGNKVVAADRAGKTLWTLATPTETFSSPALAGDVLYVGGNDNYNMKGKGCLLAVDAKTGKQLWNLELPASVWASPVVAHNTVYVSCANGKVYAVR